MAKALANRNVRYKARDELSSIFFSEKEKSFADFSENAENQSKDFATVRESKSPNCTKVVFAIAAVGVISALICGIAVLIVFTTRDNDGDITTVPPETTRPATQTTPISSLSSTETTRAQTTTEPTNQDWSVWGQWTQCTATCDNGFQKRYRICNEQLSSMCDGSFEQTRVCSESSCPVYGKWTTWESWGSCDVTCGGGSHVRTRTCLKANAVDLDCVGDDAQTQSCSNWTCPDCTQTCHIGLLNGRCDICICENSLITGRIFAKASGNPITGAALYAQTAPTQLLTQSNTTGFFSLNSTCTKTKLFVTKEGFIDTIVEVNETYLEINMARIVKPFLTEAPQTKYRLANENVTLCCKASASPEIVNYEWFKDSNLMDDSLVIFETQILLTNLSITDSGNYQCRANSNAGAVMSPVAVLTVKGTPEDFCQDALQQKTILLPDDCIQSHTNTSTYDVGDCASKKCRITNALNTGVCREELNSCCSPKEFKIETVNCSSYTMDLVVVKSCSCAACSTPEIIVSGVATGLHDNLPVTFASVYLNGEFISYTTANGLFEFTSNNTGIRWTLNIQDNFNNEYLPATKIIETDDDMSGIFDIKVKMIKASEPIEVDSTKSNILIAGPAGDSNDSNVLLAIPANAFYYKNGSLFTGKVAARLTYIDPSNTSIFDDIPGEFSYVDEEGQLRNLATLGVFNLYFEDQLGNSITLNKAVDAYIPNVIGNNTSYENFKLWLLNSQTGIWESEGENVGKRRKRRDTSTWIGELSDISETHWYNYDEVDEISNNLCYFNYRLFKDRFLTVTDNNENFYNTKLKIHMKREKILHIIEHPASWRRTQKRCATVACDNQEAYITGRIYQDALYVAKPYPESSIRRSISTDERVLKATMTSSKSGPFYQSQYTCEASYPPASYLSFFRGISDFEWKFNEDLVSCNHEIAESIRLRYWYPNHILQGFRVCYLKVDINSDTDVRINENEMKIRVFSYGGDNSDIQDKILGIHEKVVNAQNGTYCIEYRCSGYIDTCNEKVRDHTKVKIILEYPKAHFECLVDSLAAQLVVDQPFDQVGHDGLFEFNVPHVDGGLGYGIYTQNAKRNNAKIAVKQAKEMAHNYCLAGSLYSNVETSSGYAVSFKCRLRTK